MNWPLRLRVGTCDGGRRSGCPASSNSRPGLTLPALAILLACLLPGVQANPSQYRRPRPPPLHYLYPEPAAAAAKKCGVRADGKPCKNFLACCSTEGYCGKDAAHCGKDVCASGACQKVAFNWVPLGPAQKRKAEQLLSIFENSQLEPDYGYAENLHDGRGITFGRSGFCSGTGDGVLVVKRYVALKPSTPTWNNTLERFVPVLEKARGGNVAGLEGFTEAVQALWNDTQFRAAQDYYSDRLYFQPSQDMARSLGLKLPIAKAQLYDAYVQHGEADLGTSDYDVSANGMADWVCKQLGGSPLQGVDEQKWYRWYLFRRRNVLQDQDSAWAESLQRTDIYHWINFMGGGNLDRPLRMRWKRCRADKQPGPCVPQVVPLRELQMGGVTYGDFLLP